MSIKKIFKDNMHFGIIGIILNDGTDLWVKCEIARSYNQDLLNVKPIASITREPSGSIHLLRPEKEIICISKYNNSTDYKVEYGHKKELMFSPEELRSIQSLM